jgi:TRAP-type C4-dicarboxylate transport system substrate-binding protein
LAAEPEIDIAAAIEECINESMTKLATAIQERTDQLLETLAAADATIVAPTKRKP